MKFFQRLCRTKVRIFGWAVLSYKKAMHMCYRSITFIRTIPKNDNKKSNYKIYYKVSIHSSFINCDHCDRLDRLHRIKIYPVELDVYCFFLQRSIALKIGPKFCE